MAAIVAVSQAVVVPAPLAYGHGPVLAPAYGPAIAKVAAPVVAKVADDYDPNPQYSYSYDIHVSTKWEEDNDLADPVSKYY